MKIRKASPGDADSIAELYLQLKRHHGTLTPGSPRYATGDGDWKRYVRAGLEDESKRIYVAVRGPEVIGLVKLFFDQKSWGLACEVETLIVDEASRHLGVGNALMRHVEQLARDEGALGMRVNVLHVNGEGRRFYERDGYHTVAIRYGKPL